MTNLATAQTAKWEPYLGPAPFEREHSDRFFGRDGEADDLACLIEAHQVVLLYAQSGAGKSSLINAKLIPILDEHECDVAVVRPGRPPAVPLASATGLNPFVLNSLSDLHSACPTAGILKAETVLAGVASWCQTRSPGRPARFTRVLVLDQFEETFTFPSARRGQHRKDFMQQVGKLLSHDPDLRVLFSIREEYIASLEPYASNFDGFRTRRRLERLRKEQALEAITKPLRPPYRWEKEAVEHLVRELLTIEIPDIDGQTRKLTDDYIQPVQLSVACKFVWERLLASRETTITKQFVVSAGDVNAALCDFYETAIKLAVRDRGADERKLRRFCHFRLITEHGTRGSCLKGDGETGDVPNVALDLLDSMHLTKSEWRSGSVWYELTHDRFIPPILEANRVWLQRELKPEQLAISEDLRQKAKRWDVAGRHDQDLYSESDLLKAQTLLVSPAAADLGLNAEVVRTCFESSRERLSRQTQATLRNQNSRLGMWAIAAAILVVVAVGFAGYARLKGQEVRAQASVLEAAQGSLKYSNAELSFTNAVLNYGYDLVEIRRVQEEIRLARDKTQKSELEDSLNDSRNNLEASKANLESTGTQWIEAQREDVTAERKRQETWLSELKSVTNPQGAADKLLRAPGQVADPAAKVLRARYAIALDPRSHLIPALHSAMSEMRLTLTGHKGQVFPVVFLSPNVLLSGGADSTVRKWDALSGTMIDLFVGHVDSVFDLSATADQRHLVTVSADGTARIWDADKPTNRPLDVGGRVWGTALSTDGRILATASTDGRIRLWDVQSGASIGPSLEPFKSPMYGVAFSPDGKYLAAVGQRGAAIYRLDALTAPQWQLTDHRGIVYRAAFSPDGTKLVTTSLDQTALLYEFPISGPPIPLIGHKKMLGVAAFSRQGTMVASASLDGTVRLWNARSGAQLDVRQSKCGPTFGVAFSTDDSLLAAGCTDNVQIWPIAGQAFRSGRGPALLVPVPPSSLEDLLLFSHTLVNPHRAEPKDLTADECRLYIGRPCPRVVGSPLP